MHPLNFKANDFEKLFLKIVQIELNNQDELTIIGSIISVKLATNPPHLPMTLEFISKETAAKRTLFITDVKSISEIV